MKIDVKSISDMIKSPTFRIWIIVEVILALFTVFGWFAIWQDWKFLGVCPQPTALPFPCIIRYGFFVAEASVLLMLILAVIYLARVQDHTSNRNWFKTSIGAFISFVCFYFLAGFMELFMYGIEERFGSNYFSPYLIFVIPIIVLGLLNIFLRKKNVNIAQGILWGAVILLILLFIEQISSFVRSLY